MIKVKRSAYILFSLEDRPVFDLSTFLKGELNLTKKCQVVACSLIAQDPHPLTQSDLELLVQVPEQWTSLSQLANDLKAEPAELESLINKGILITDSDQPEHARIREREEQLTALQWHPFAAVYHLMTRGPDNQADQTQPLVDVEELALLASENATKFVARFGPPPAAFHHRPEASSAFELPVIKRDSALYEALDRRKTSRTFDRNHPMDLERLAILIYYAFGCHGYTRFSPELISLKKSSPSAGSLHPIEAYPLIIDVAGLETGFYHYDVEHHALELLEPMSRPEAEELAVQMAAGQAYVGTAHAIVVLTARFRRSFWKYRRSSRTYGVLLTDAGHLSQTFYLVATDLDLAAFYTGTVNAPKIEQTLGLDGIEEGAIGICGCGLKLADGTGLTLERKPFEPRKTKL